MSRIFDALNRTRGEFDHILDPLTQEDLYHPPIAAVASPPPLPAAPPSYRTAPLRIPLSVPLLPFDGSNARASEEYRLIRTRLLQHVTRPTMILVSSGSSGDGKTVTAVNIAGALSLKGDTKVLIVDTDFPRRTVTLVAGIPQGFGLADVLGGRSTLEEAVVRAQQMPNLFILPAGESATNPAELLDSPAWPALCRELRERFEYVVFDSPPVDATPYYGRVEEVCDGVVVVVRPDHTNRSTLSEVLKRVPEQKLLGIVLNCTKKWFLLKDHRSYYGYADRQGGGARGR